MVIDGGLLVIDGDWWWLMVIDGDWWWLMVFEFINQRTNSGDWWWLNDWNGKYEEWKVDQQKKQIANQKNVFNQQEFRFKLQKMWLNQHSTERAASLEELVPVFDTTRWLFTHIV